jgi:hypothetical protein
MSTVENKALAFRYFDQRWNHNNDAVIDELVGEGMSKARRRTSKPPMQPSVILSSPSMA